MSLKVCSYSYHSLLFTDVAFTPQGWAEPQTQGLQCVILIDWCCLLANSGSPDCSFIQICMQRNKDRKWKTYVWIFTLTAFFFCLHKANCHKQKNDRWQETWPCLSQSLMMCDFIHSQAEIIWFHPPIHKEVRGQGQLQNSSPLACRASGIANGNSGSVDAFH